MSQQTPLCDRQNCTEILPHEHCCFCNEPCNQFSQTCGRCPRMIFSNGIVPKFYLPPVVTLRRSLRIAEKSKNK